MAAFVCCIKGGCLEVQGPYILAGDLANADSRFAQLNPALQFSYAPPVGAQRIATADEIDRWAAGQGLASVHSPTLCFERTSRDLNAADVSRAIEQFLGTNYKDLRIEVMDVCRCKAPPGRLKFAPSGASVPPVGHPEAAVLWTGQVLGSDGTKYPVWARVRVLATIAIVRAAESLRAGQLIRRRDIETDQITGSPLSFREPQSLAAYEGKIINVSITHGSILRPELVHIPSDVERGSVVEVRVVNGNAQLALAARAESAGDIGQTITLTNPAGAAKFHASVIAPGRAEIVLTAPEPLGPGVLAESLQPGKTAPRAGITRP